MVPVYDLAVLVGLVGLVVLVGLACFECSLFLHPEKVVDDSDKIDNENRSNSSFFIGRLLVIGYLLLKLQTYSEPANN